MFNEADGLPDPTSRTTFVAGAVNPVVLQIGQGGDLFYMDFDGGTIRRIQLTTTATFEVTTEPIPSAPPPSGDGSGGGGCTLNRAGTGDALLPLLFLVVLGLLLVRAKRRATKADRTVT